MPVPGISCHIGGAIATGVCTVFVHGLWHTWAVAHMGCGTHGLWHTWAVASATSTWDVRGR